MTEEKITRFIFNLLRETSTGEINWKTEREITPIMQLASSYLNMNYAKNKVYSAYIGDNGTKAYILKTEKEIFIILKDNTDYEDIIRTNDIRTKNYLNLLYNNIPSKIKNIDFSKGITAPSIERAVDGFLNYCKEKSEREKTTQEILNKLKKNEN
jgi:hypothetical protein